MRRKKWILWSGFSLHPCAHSATYLVVRLKVHSSAACGGEANKNARDFAHDELDFLQLLAQFLLNPHGIRCLRRSGLRLGFVWLGQRVSRLGRKKWKHIVWSECHHVRFRTDPILNESLNPFQWLKTCKLNRRNGHAFTPNRVFPKRNNFSTW